MSLSLRLFLLYSLFIAICAYFVVAVVRDEVKPGVRQTTEETLVDTANLLAELLKQALRDGNLGSGAYLDIFKHYGERRLNANIWGFAKQRVNHRIYVTDHQGIVLLDSHNRAVGHDYSQWNDVHRTLSGEYGARSSLETVDGQPSTVMYVAAPIRDGDKIIGVVSVAKPNVSVQPFIDRSKRRLAVFGAAIAVLGLVCGGFFSWWLGRELRRLRHYALTLSQGKRASLPANALRSKELQQLAGAIEVMRRELDGKVYVEHYVQTFAHEFKSPLTGIRAAIELLQSPLVKEKQQQFLSNIEHESGRLLQLIEQLLQLAALEQQQVPKQPSNVLLGECINDLLMNNHPRIALKQLRVDCEFNPQLWVYAEKFLLQQALSNLLDNAIAFSPVQGHIRITAGAEGAARYIRIYNRGPAIPAYALSRLSERFFSLPRPDSGKKSSGLGLSLVAEMANLHRGTFSIRNIDGGVECELALPPSPAKKHTINT
ncbi:MAG: two-component system sensor histidine kinase CreC [Cellvibrionaceae bacterium]|nr:two-component system sensor histidine kinase CreC [Cellvibrionaceae bacterium]